MASDRRAVVLLGVVLVSLPPLLVACGDKDPASISLTPGMGVGEAVMETSITQRSTSRVSSPASRWQSNSQKSTAQRAFHQKNKFDWVGIAHNRGLDAVRAELRKPGYVVNDLCGMLERSLTGWADVPQGISESGAADQVARGVRIGIASWCESTSRDQESLRAVAYTGALSMQDTVSAEAHALVAAIGGAVDYLSTSDALATDMVPILDSASALGGADEEYVHIMASVAVSSAEYWEVEAEGFYQDVMVDFESCMANAPGDHAARLAHCEGMFAEPISYRDSLIDLSSPPRITFALASYHPARLRQCGTVGGMWKGWVKTDFLGGAGVFFASFALGPVSAPAVVGGALGSSAADALWDTTAALICYEQRY